MNIKALKKEKGDLDRASKQTMKALDNLTKTVIAGIVLAIVLFIFMYSISGGWELHTYFLSAIFPYLNVY